MVDQPSSEHGHVRAEFLSVAGFLSENLAEPQRARVLLPGFNQWHFALDALVETAIGFRDIGAEVTFAFWADATPMVDTGWTTSHALARLLRSPALDERYAMGLRSLGFGEECFTSPPILDWTPVGALPLIDGLQRSDVRELTYRDSAVGRAILQVRPQPMTPTAEDHEWPKRWVEACVRSYAFVYDQIAQVIEDRRISTLVTYNGRFLHDRAAVAAARAAGVSVLYYDQGGSDTAFDLTGDQTHDWVALQERMRAMYDAWPPDERDELGASWFWDRASHTDPRNAHFTDGQEPGTMVDLPEGECVVVYFSSSSDEIAELEVDWSEYFGDQHEALRQVAAVCRSLPGYRLVIRSHPHKRHKPTRDVQEWLQVVDEVDPDLHIGPHSSVDSYSLMQAADLVITYGSTTGVEAGFAGKPVIVLGPSAYDEIGCAIRPKTKEELASAIRERSVGTQHGAILYGLMMKRRGFHADHITLNDKGERTLGGVPLEDSRELVRHGSHLMAKWRRRYLTN